MSAYNDWVAACQADMASIGYPSYGSTDWACVTMPVNANSGHAGEPALRLSSAAYATAYNAGFLPSGPGTYEAPSGDYYYVLASAMTGSGDVVASAPHVMTASERAANASFTAFDEVSNAVGLPSLGNFAKDVGTQILVGVAVAAGAALLLKRRK